MGGGFRTQNGDMPRRPRRYPGQHLKLSGYRQRLTAGSTTAAARVCYRAYTAVIVWVLSPLPSRFHRLTLAARSYGHGHEEAAPRTTLAETELARLGHRRGRGARWLRGALAGCCSLVALGIHSLGATTITITPSGNVSFGERYTVFPISAVSAICRASIVGVPRAESTTFAVMVTPVSIFAPADCTGATIPQWGGYVASDLVIGATGILLSTTGQCAANSKKNSWVANNELSGSSTYRTQNEIGGGAADTIFMNAAWSTILRRVNLVSRAMIFSFWERITDCWASRSVFCLPVMPSSNPNKSRVQAASITTPTKTAATGIETIFGASSMTPRPTRAPPTMVPAIKIAWGQVGSSAPPKNWLMYEYIAAVLVWLFAGAAVIFRCVRHRRGR
jgi:hypothetical protein